MANQNEAGRPSWWTFVAVAVMGVSAAALFTCLLVSKNIGEASYVILISLDAMTSLVLLGLPRLLSLDLKSMTMTLAKVEAANDELAAKQADLRKLAGATARLILFNAGLMGRVSGRQPRILNWYRTQANQVISLAGLSESEQRDVLKYFEGWEKHDALGDDKSAERTALAEQLYKQMEADTEPHKSS